MATMCITRSCQTMYRESEAQTIPWAPPYTVISTETPEVLMLACLTWGCGLPAGKYEIEVIERLRKKRAWERHLAANVHPQDFEGRRRIISDIEQSEWLFREKELEEIQALRFDLAQKELRKHEKDLKCRIEKRLRLIAEKALREKKGTMVKIQKEKDRALRKLKLRCKGGVKRYTRQGNIIEDFICPVSNLAVPLPRLGFDNRLTSEVLCVQPPFPVTFEGLCKLEVRPWKSKNVMCSVRPPVHNCLGSSYMVDNSLPQNELELVYGEDNVLDDVVFEVGDSGPPTPSCEVFPDLDELIYQSGLLIQRVVRGRAVQTMMHQGRTKQQDLIDELKSTFGLLPEEIEQRTLERRQVMTSVRDYSVGKKKLEKVMSTVEQLEGSTISRLADFAAKELLRLQDESKAHELALLAEEERWRREATESGRRQLELRQLRQFDEIIRQLLKGNEWSVDSVLEDASKDSLRSTAREVAKETTKQFAQEFEKKGPTAHCKDDLLDAEEACSRLLYNFLLPEANRRVIRARLAQNQEVCRRSALEDIYKKKGETQPDLDFPPVNFEQAGSSVQTAVEKRDPKKRKKRAINKLVTWHNTKDSTKSKYHHPIVELSLASVNAQLSQHTGLHVFEPDGRYYCPDNDLPLHPVIKGQGVWWWIPV